MSIVFGKKHDIQRMIYNFYLEIITREPLTYTMDHPKFIVSNQKEKSIRVLLRVKCSFLLFQTVYECCKTEASRQLELAAVSIYGLTKIKAVCIS